MPDNEVIIAPPVLETEVLNPAVKDDVEALIRGFQINDPKLFAALQLLNQQVGDITLKLAPLVRQALGLVEVNPPPAIGVINFRSESTGDTVRFDWDQVGFVPLMYEVREGTIAFIEDKWIRYQTFGEETPWWDMETPSQKVPWYTPVVANDWETANFRFRTTNFNANIAPILEGDHLFLLKALDSSGSYSLETLTTRFVVTKISTVIITKNIIDNNVLLYWAPPTSIFNIREYRLYKDGLLKGTTGATFAAFFELVPGSYTYSIIAVDVAGNLGIETFITALVNQPPDFALQDSRTSDLSGTRVNVLLESGPRLLCCWLASTFQAHFTGRSWLTPRNQIDAGYPIYIQPSTINGSYEEIFDYGAIFSNVIVTTTWNLNILTPASIVNILVKMSVSSDGLNYSAFSNGSSQFFASFQYLRLRLEFVGADDRALIELYNLTINLNVKREMDGGEVFSPLTDVNGTEVFFTKPFKDIESITCTVKSVKEPYMVIYNFQDIPNPVHFFVFVFDTAGNRATKTVEWKARGIV